MNKLKGSTMTFVVVTLIFIFNMMVVRANDIDTDEYYFNYTNINSSYRATNQLIIYTSTYPNKTSDGFTGTNAYGYEAAVNSNGNVIDVATHVKIPTDGFVLSGHGTAAKFIQENIKIGSIVTYDVNTNKIKVVNSETKINLLTTEFELLKVKSKIDEAKEKLYDVNLYDAILNYNKAKELYDEAISLYESTDDQVNSANLIREKCNQAKALLLTVNYQTMPSTVLEGRAIWHRPNEYTLDQIKRNLDKFQELGINLIYVETLWGYYSNYPSEILDTHSTLAYNKYGEYGKDYLQAFITEAHKRGIEVHAWAEIFSMYSHSKVAQLHPDWILINEDGSTDNGQGHFLDPANKEVRAFILSIIQEMLSKYDLDGFQYDYIRYPSEDEVKSGYTDVAMNEFKQLYGLTGDVKELIKNPIIKAKWDDYRRNVISQFVKEMTTLIRTYDNINISMAVVPSAEQAKNKYMQDWSLWIKNGWIDTIAPMVYVADPNYAKTIAADIQEITSNKTYQYTGIAPVYYGSSVLINQEQIVLINEVALGNAMFASHNLLGKQEFEEALKISTNRKQAVLPHGNLHSIVNVVFNDILDKAERIYIPNQKMDETQLDQLRTELNRINLMSKGNAKEIFALKDELFVLSLYLNIYADGEAQLRISEDLSRLMNVLDIKISQDLIIRGYWDPENEDERPDVNQFEYPVIGDIEDPIQEEDSVIIIQPIKKNPQYLFPLIIGGIMILSSGYLFFRIKKTK